MYSGIHGLRALLLVVCQSKKWLNLWEIPLRQSEKITSILHLTIWMTSMSNCQSGAKSGAKITCRQAISTLPSSTCALLNVVLARPEWLLLIDNRQLKIKDFRASRSTYGRQDRTKSGAKSAAFLFLAQFALLKFDSYFRNFNRGNGGKMLSFALKSDSCCCHTNQRQLAQP